MRRMPQYLFQYLILFLLICSGTTTVQAQLIPGLGASTNSNGDTDEIQAELKDIRKKANAFESELEKY